MRRVALRLHRWGGLAMGALVSVVSLSGAFSLLAGDFEARELAERWTVEPPEEAGRMPPTALLATVREHHPGVDPFSVELRRDDTRPAIVRVRGSMTVFLDPWRGRIVGEQGAEESLSARLVSLHTRLFAGGAGGLIVLVTTVVLVAMIPLGIVLWWPRRRALRRALTLRLRRGFRRANYDLHNVLGFYSAALLLVLAGTGVLLAVPSLRDLGVRAVAHALPAPDREPRRVPEAVAGPAPEGVDALDAALARGRRLFPDAAWIRAILPRGSSSTIQVLVAADADGESTRHHTVVVGGDGAVRRIERYEDASPAERFGRLVNQLHTASGLGTAYRWVAFTVCLVGGTLPLTGFVMWLDRQRRARRRVRRERASRGGAARGDG